MADILLFVVLVLALVFAEPSQVHSHRCGVAAPRAVVAGFLRCAVRECS